jgi:hypothetical protein
MNFMKKVDFSTTNYERTKATHCTKGHPFDEQNTKWILKEGRWKSRKCLRCAADRSKKSYDKQMLKRRLNFFPEEVADALNQLADLAGPHETIQVKGKYLRQLAQQLINLPPPGKTKLDFEDRIYRGLETITVQATTGKWRVLWYSSRTIDITTWNDTYDLGWRPARFPVPMEIKSEI